MPIFTASLRSGGAACQFLPPPLPPLTKSLAHPEDKHPQSSLNPSLAGAQAAAAQRCRTPGRVTPHPPKKQCSAPQAPLRLEMKQISLGLNPLVCV